jgi:DNA-binding MarR family transcriptional regulator
VAEPQRPQRATSRVGESPPRDVDVVLEAQGRWQAAGLPNSTSMAAAVSVLRVAQIVSANLDAALRPYGLTYGRYQVLGTLRFSRGGRRSMGKIAAGWHVHPATFTNTVDRLEADKFVRRAADPSDRRSTLLVITRIGLTLFETATAALDAANFGLQDMEPSQAETITEMFTNIRRDFGDFVDQLDEPASAKRRQTRERGRGNSSRLSST